MFRPERLTEQRKKNKLTQEQLAFKVNLTKAAISNYEQGRSAPPHETLVALVDALHTNADYLLGISDDPLNAQDKNITKIINDGETTIHLLEEEARKMGLSPSDPKFLKMLSDAFEMLRIARGQNKE